MGFETRVLDVVKPALGETGVAEFSYGTLFVDHISSEQAENIHNKLRGREGFGNVEVTRIGKTNEYAYDFV